MKNCCRTYVNRLTVTATVHASTELASVIQVSIYDNVTVISDSIILCANI